MIPETWRKIHSLTVQAAAELVGLAGKNPARTWKRWEIGERSPSIEKVALIERLSGGALTAESWAAARRAFNEPKTASRGNTAAHTAGSSPNPTADTDRSREPAPATAGEGV